MSQTLYFLHISSLKVYISDVSVIFFYHIYVIFFLTTDMLLLFTRIKIHREKNAKSKSISKLEKVAGLHVCSSISK